LTEDEHDERPFIQANFGINDVRLIYNSVSFFLENWPGTPERPAEEEGYLLDMKTKLYSMLLEYNYYSKTADE
tara:strand:+ start:450 stop:668 length:219 start_codon:yes stop_codon:yes gene_type:complete